MNPDIVIDRIESVIEDHSFPFPDPTIKRFNTDDAAINHGEKVYEVTYTDDREDHDEEIYQVTWDINGSRYGFELALYDDVSDDIVLEEQLPRMVRYTAEAISENEDL